MIKLDLFTLEKKALNDFFFPENALDLLGKNLSPWLLTLLNAHNVHDDAVVFGEVHKKAHIEGPVYIAKGAKVEPFAYIKGPCFVGEGTEVRHGAYLRGDVYAGKNCVLGHSTEIKSSVFMDGAKAGHFAYVGNSILCQNVNLGAGTKLANLKLGSRPVKVQIPNENRRFDTGLKKMGAIVGDNCETGCNSVLSPGSLLLPQTKVMPCHHFHGTIEKGIAGS